MFLVQKRVHPLIKAETCPLGVLQQSLTYSFGITKLRMGETVIH
jgi:hypothetical protein